MRRCCGYPPPHARAPRALGAAPTARVVYLDYAAPDRAAGDGSGSLRADRGFHALLPEATIAGGSGDGGATALLDRVLPAAAADAQAAADAAAADRRAQDAPPPVHLWKHLDPPLFDKSAPVRAAVQARYVRALISARGVAPPGLREWLALAQTVGQGMHALFAHGARGWDAGLAVYSKDDPENIKELIRNEWWPFEDYDPTTLHPRYAGCFGACEGAARLRARVRIDGDAEVAERWAEGAACARRMLDMEGAAGTGAAGDPLAGLTPAQIGGLFLLTHVADNCAKRAELFNADFWMLRAVHFGLERVTELRMQQLSLRTLYAAAPPGGRERLVANPARAHCRVESALHTLVAMKVVVFLRLRWHALDAADGRPPSSEVELQRRVRVDRHDVELSKKGCRGAVADAADPPTGPARKRPRSRRLADALDAELADLDAARDEDAPTPVPLGQACAQCREALSRLAQRFCDLEFVVCAFAAKERAIAEATEAVRGRLLASLAAMTESERAAHSEALTSTSVRARAIDEVVEGVGEVRLRPEEDGVLATREQEPFVLDAIAEHGPEDANALDGRLFITDRERWCALFGRDGNGGAAGAAAHGEPETGLAWREAVSVLQRLHAVGAFLETHQTEEGKGQAALVVPPLAAEARFAPQRWCTDRASPFEDSSRLDPAVEAYRRAVRAEDKRARRYAAFVEEAEQNMAHAIRTCFVRATQLATGPAPDMEHDGDDDASTASGHSDAELPLREYATAIASDVVLTILGIAQLHSGFVDERAVARGADWIVAYNHATGAVTLRAADWIVRHRWPAAVRLLGLARSAEAFLRDPRRRGERVDPLALGPARRYAGLAHCRPGGVAVRAHASAATAFEAHVDAHVDAHADDWWPQWPPASAAQLRATPADARRALLWGRSAGRAALGLPPSPGAAAARPDLPYAGLAGKAEARTPATATPTAAHRLFAATAGSGPCAAAEGEA